MRTIYAKTISILLLCAVLFSACGSASAAASAQDNAAQDTAVQEVAAPDAVEAAAQDNANQDGAEAPAQENAASTAADSNLRDLYAIGALHLWKGILLVGDLLLIQNPHNIGLVLVRHGTTSLPPSYHITG